MKLRTMTKNTRTTVYASLLTRKARTVNLLFSQVILLIGELIPTLRTRCPEIRTHCSKTQACFYRRDETAIRGKDVTREFRTSPPTGFAGNLEKPRNTLTIRPSRRLNARISLTLSRKDSSLRFDCYPSRIGYSWVAPVGCRLLPNTNA